MAGKASAHRDSGGGSTQFEVRGGDNSIQESGHEATAAEFQQAAAALHGYLDARAAGAWATACRYLVPGVVAQLKELVPPDPEAPKRKCADLLAAASAGFPRSALREAAVADIGSLRVDGTTGFLLFRGAGGIAFFVPMAREGGRWTVAALAPSVLP